ncbi:hypothetical protein AZE42_08309 [Rhizopogon vesiculosus]|uniref:Uncharacterized protein n=1 Tax=Rhizopogon vesiculosus TaxID=180088 RepID=A0A1J8PHI5_9AGAM|nr:hypothetical protein AZE42_08309 [Rhizopogon vesiculosus]
MPDGLEKYTCQPAIEFQNTTEAVRDDSVTIAAMALLPATMIILVPYLYPEVYDSSTILYPESTPSTPYHHIPPDALHPILDLSMRAKEEWTNLACANRTLPDAT